MGRVVGGSGPEWQGIMHGMQCMACTHWQATNCRPCVVHKGGHFPCILFCFRTNKGKVATLCGAQDVQEGAETEGGLTPIASSNAPWGTPGSQASFSPQMSAPAPGGSPGAARRASRSVDNVVSAPLPCCSLTARMRASRASAGHIARLSSPVPPASLDPHDSAGLQGQLSTSATSPAPVQAWGDELGPVSPRPVPLLPSRLSQISGAGTPPPDRQRRATEESPSRMHNNSPLPSPSPGVPSLPARPLPRPAPCPALWAC